MRPRFPMMLAVGILPVWIVFVWGRIASAAGVEVIVPRPLPRGVSVWMAVPRDAGWTPCGIRLERKAPRRWTLPAGAAPPAACRFSLGSWNTLEMGMDAEGRLFETLPRRVRGCCVSRIDAWREGADWGCGARVSPALTVSRTALVFSVLLPAREASLRVECGRRLLFAADSRLKGPSGDGTGVFLHRFFWPFRDMGPRCVEILGRGEAAYSFVWSEGGSSPPGRRPSAGPWPLRFDAAGFVDPGAPCDFFVFGDTRSGHEVHSELVERLLGEDMVPAFAVHTGDMIGNGRKRRHWRRFFSLEGPLFSRTPLVGVLGNHERRSPWFFDYFAPSARRPWFSFDCGPVHCVVLSTQHPAVPQLEWLRGDLSLARRVGRDPWVVLFMHKPLFAAGGHGGSGGYAAVWADAFSSLGVDLVFAGHNHLYERCFHGGVWYVTTGGGGAPLYGRRSGREPAEAGTAVGPLSVYHYCRVRATPGTLRLHVRSLDGRGLDRLVLERTPRKGGPGGGEGG